MTEGHPSGDGFDLASGSGRLRPSTLRQLSAELADLARDEAGLPPADGGTTRGSCAEQVPHTLRGEGEPVARAIAATLAGPVLHVRIDRRIAGSQATGDVWWSPAASVAIGGYPSDDEPDSEPDGGRDDEPPLVVIAAGPTSFGEQVVRMMRLADHPAAPSAVAAVDARDLAAAVLGERTEPLVGVAAEHLVLVEAELVGAPGPATFAGRRGPARPTSIGLLAAAAAAETEPAATRIVRGLVDAPAGSWRIVAPDEPPDGPPPATATSPFVGLQPHSAAAERTFFDEVARRTRDAVVMGG